MHPFHVAPGVDAQQADVPLLQGCLALQQLRPMLYPAQWVKKHVCKPTEPRHTKARVAALKKVCKQVRKLQHGVPQDMLERTVARALQLIGGARRDQ